MYTQVFIVDSLFLCDYFHYFYAMNALPDPQIRKTFQFGFFFCNFPIHLEYNLLYDVKQDFKVNSPPPVQNLSQGCNLCIICILFPLEYYEKHQFLKPLHGRNLNKSHETSHCSKAFGGGVHLSFLLLQNRSFTLQKAYSTLKHLGAWFPHPLYSFFTIICTAKGK